MVVRVAAAALAPSYWLFAGALVVIGDVGQDVRIVGRRRVEVVAERAVTGRHRLDVGGGDGDVVDQGLAGLLVVAFVVVGGHEALITPEQVHLRPVHPVVVGADVLEQSDPGAAAGQYDQRAAAGRDGTGDRLDQPLARGGDQC